MREICESCARAQPPDWTAGELCCYCGSAVRREVRCFWCVAWTPAASFCRSCGAAVVEETAFAAARMLKDAGSDRFSIPKMLREFPADQLENFTRIYQRQAVVVARHVDELRLIEGVLGAHAWSAALEDELTAQLPWTAAGLAGWSAGAGVEGGASHVDLDRVVAIQRHTPVGLTSALAGIARLRLGDAEAQAAVVALLGHDDARVRQEAALALGTWRIWARATIDRATARRIVAELTAAPASPAAVVGRSLFGSADPDALRSVRAGADAELDFAIALLVGDVDRLLTGLAGDELMRIAAGRALIALGQAAALATPLATVSDEVLGDWLATLVRRKEPYPELRAVLLERLEQHADATVRERCARLLCRGLPAELAVRIARAAHGDRSIYQSLLQPDAALPPDAIAAVVAVMIETKTLIAQQYGLLEAAARGAVPDDLVIRQFTQAGAEARLALLRIAEEQLGARGDEALHRFVMGLVFGAYPSGLRAASWWTLCRWYKRQGDHRGEGPFRLTAAGVERFFGSMAVFLPLLTDVLTDRATMKEVGIFELLAMLLASSDDSALQAMRETAAATDALVAVLLTARHEDYWPNTLDAMTDLVSRIGTLERWTAPVLAGLERAPRRGNYHFDQALRRVQLAQYGILEERRWSELAPDYAMRRFDQVPPAGQHELLALSEHQLIHRPQPEMAPVMDPFLLGVALRDYDPALRVAAIRLRRARISRPQPLRSSLAGLSMLSAPGIEVLPGLLAGVLGCAPLMAEPAMREVVAELIAVPPGAPALLAIPPGEAALPLVQALLVLLGGGAAELDGLRRGIIRLLLPQCRQAVWRAAFAATLQAVVRHGGGSLATEATAALTALRQDESPGRGPA